MLFLINCRYGSTFTKFVPPQTGLPHCLVLILIPIRANAKFMVVLSSVFMFFTKRLQEAGQRSRYSD